MKNNCFYTLDYIPNKLVFVYDINKTEIRFLAFININNEGLKAIKHSISTVSKKDFKKPINCFNPTNEVKNLINKELVFQLT